MSDDESDGRQSPSDDRDTSRTLASSAHDVRFEHGRTYAGRGTHPIPNDELNTINERNAHHLFLRLLHDKLFLAPVKKFDKILDLGSGTGLWAIDMADAYPDAKVIGLDLNPYRGNDYVPHNCELRVEDIRGEWLPDNTDFDFVHIRSLFGFDMDDWPTLYEQVYLNLVPGGYIEHIEVELEPKTDDDTMLPNSPFLKVEEITRSISQSTAKHYHITDAMRELMEEAKFTEITETRFKMPIGAWHSDPYWREIGELYADYVKTGIQGWILQLLTTEFGWTVEQVNELSDTLADAIDRHDEHVYYTFTLIYGKKPEE